MFPEDFIAPGKKDNEWIEKNPNTNSGVNAREEGH
jgi:hypothetical protein